MLVEEIMTPKEKLVIVSQMAPVREALRLMKENGVKAVIVDKSSEHGAYGLVTFKNILYSIVAEDGDIDLLNVFDIMSSPSISVSRKLDIKYAARMMVKNSIKRLLVIDDNEIYGILTMTDIIGVVLEDMEA
ncbi:CBS domain-containing protein [Hydrogenimonas sp.]|jgi:signal-transduction protein with cAMP-binding, CBS, and nucleotidyltransferase domain|uniref:CBS domain-containing protein n=1 Tax=Hydrogenimonas sp. TaxID=2231112 RepID=UPI00260DBB26|nr:CBS domain-containing protein [Hydrogenimonas sp.]